MSKKAVYGLAAFGIVFLGLAVFVVAALVIGKTAQSIQQASIPAPREKWEPEILRRIHFKPDRLDTARMSGEWDRKWFSDGSEAVKLPGPGDTTEIVGAVCVSKSERVSGQEYVKAAVFLIYKDGRVYGPLDGVSHTTWELDAKRLLDDEAQKILDRRRVEEKYKH